MSAIPEDKKARKSKENEAFLLALEYARLHDYYHGEPVTQREKSLMKLALHASTEPEVLEGTIRLMREDGSSERFLT